MGKKTKRNRSKAPPSSSSDARTAPALRSETEEIETKDNLRFEDPFVEEIQDEFTAGDDDDEDMDDPKQQAKQQNSNMEDDDGEYIQSWNPLTGERLAAGETLEMDASAYQMHHALAPKWPALSLSLIRDDLGFGRKRFPHSLIAVAGSQADRPEHNELTVMKLSDLSRLPKPETEDDILGEEYHNDNDHSDDDDSEDEVDLDPILESYSIPHVSGGVNRVRSMPQKPEIVATWSDAGTVNLFNIENILKKFKASEGRNGGGGSRAGGDIPSKPFFEYSGHGTEGFAMDWSPSTAGNLVTGDCDGNIHLWTPQEGGGSALHKKNGGYSVTPAYSANTRLSVDAPMRSVEDLQWSPTEATVFCSAECGGYIRIFDTRAHHKAMITEKIHANGADVNVVSWNQLVGNLIATGGDDGCLSVWDLRHFKPSSATTDDKSNSPNALARFTPHKTPISSVEWHPTDESMLVATDDDGTYVYDLSVEEDDNARAANGGDSSSPSIDVPPQLLFVHCGSEQFKEAHWHPQISSCIMTTALSGFSTFIPSNL